MKLGQVTGQLRPLQLSKHVCLPGDLEEETAQTPRLQGGGQGLRD